MDPHKQQQGHGKVALALEGTLAVPNNQIKCFFTCKPVEAGLQTDQCTGVFCSFKISTLI